MEKITLEVVENALDKNEDAQTDIRTLKDLELVLVGGGDDAPHWP